MDVAQLAKILKERRITSGAGVPCSILTPVVNTMTVDEDLDYLSATSEGEAVAIAAGLVTGGRPALALMQNSGLGNAVNPITSMLNIYQIPVVLLISHRGEPNIPDAPQHEWMGRITEDLTRLCGLRTHVLHAKTFRQTLGAALDDGVPAAWICRKGTLTGAPSVPPIALKLVRRSYAPVAANGFEPTMSREQALEAILPCLDRGMEDGRGGPTTPAVIGTTGKLSRELYENGDRDHSKLNRFYMVGSMGCAAGFGLGVARAQPRRKVLVLDGDGSLLMKLGSLATIGYAAPANLHHVLFDNGAHDTTGGQPTVSPGVDFATMATACGYRLAETVADREALIQTLDRHVDADGPTFLRVTVHTGSRSDLGRPELTPRDNWLRFCRFLPPFIRGRSYDRDHSGDEPS